MVEIPLELQPRNQFFLDDFQYGMQIFFSILFLEFYQPKETSTNKSKKLPTSFVVSQFYKIV